MPDTLKDFLIGFGFKVDTTSQKRAETAIAQTEQRATKTAETESSKRVGIEKREQDKRDRERASAEKKEGERRAKSLKDAQSFVLKLSSFAAKAAATVEASALGVVYAVDKAAKSYDRLNWMAQRTGAKPGSIGAFGYASSQLGSSADEAHASLEAFGQKLRLYGQGYGQALGRLGVKTKDAKGHLRDTAEIATDLGDALRRIQQNGGSTGYTQAIVQAKMFGIDEVQARAMMNPDFRKRENQYRSDQAKVGANPDAAAQSGTAFEQSMRHLEEVLDQVDTKINGVLFVKLKPLLDQLAEWFAKNGDRVAGIVARVADDLVKLAAAIGEKIAGADWDKILNNVERLAKSFDELSTRLTGDSGLTALFTLFGVALATKVLAPLLGITRALGTIAVFSVPPWLAAMLAPLALSGDTKGDGPTKEQYSDAKQKEREYFAREKVQSDAQSELTKHHLASRGGVKRAWDWAKGKLGGDDGHVTGNDALWARGRKAKSARRAASSGDAPQATTPGVYRPQYRLGDADTSDAVVNTVAGEALAGNRESTDAVINNMMNRVGTTAYGPSGNLQEVARAPGQYAGYRTASTKEAEFIRSRIRAIASGGVPDNTNGSNEYRASSYHGPWYQHHSDAPVVGGNRFAFNEKGGRGTYSPYPSGHYVARPAPLASAPPMPAPGVPQGLKGGGYTSLGLGPDGRPVHLGPSPAAMQSISNSTKGDTNVTHNPVFNIHGTGGNGPAMLEAARRTASRGQQDLLRNIQGAEQ